MRQISRPVSMLVLACGLVLGISIGTARVATASSIAAGLDYFRTAPGAFVDLTAVGLGMVPLEGDPFDGLTDTIVQRIDAIDPLGICPDFPCSGIIDTEIVALSLTSVDPVDLTPLGGPFVGVFSDLYFTIDVGGAFGLPQPDVLDPSIGQMEITHSVADGGTFDSCFGDFLDLGVCAWLGVPSGGVYADMIATIVGGDPSNPLDVLFSMAAPRIALSADDAPWSHTAPAHYPGSGDFFPGVVPGTGGTVVETICHNDPFPCPHPVLPAPEPGTGLLLGAGLIGLAINGRRRRV